MRNQKFSTTPSLATKMLFRPGSKFDKYDKTKYLRRLCTKNMATYKIASKLNGKIFDSKEYLSGFSLLSQKGLNIENMYAFDIHSMNPNFLMIKEYLLRHKLINSNRILPISVSLIQGLNGESKGLVDKIRKEIKTQTFEQIKTEITVFLHEEYKQKITDAIPKLLKSVIGLKLGVVSYLSIIKNSFDLANMDNYKKDYSVISQLIANAYRYEKGLNTDYKLNYLINKIKRFFNRNIEIEDIEWINTQRSMDKWTSGLYIPYYEKEL